MEIAATVTTLLVAALHVGFFVLESVLWATPTGRRVFAMKAEQAEATRVLASNQGVYNLVLALGLGWSVWAGEDATRTFLLVFVVAVGVYGAASVSRTILLLQALPAAVALALGWAAAS